MAYFIRINMSQGVEIKICVPQQQLLTNYYQDRLKC